MRVLSVEQYHDINFFKLEEDNNKQIAEELFPEREPRSRLIADIIKSVEGVVKERQKLIEHPAYVKYLDIKQIEGEYCLLRMGSDIYKPLAFYIQEKEYSLKDVLDWMITLAEVGQEAEEKGIKWEVITLQSLWIDQNGKLKFVDPDIIKLTGKYRSIEGLKPDEVYQPAEIFQSKEWDQQGRIYSAGVIFYYLATGQKPFTSEDKSDLVDEIMNTKPLEPIYLNHKISPKLNTFIITALASDRNKRITDWKQFINKLNKIKRENLIYASKEKEQQFAAKAEKIIKSTNRRKSLRVFWRKSWKLITITLAVVAVFIGIGFFGGSDPYITETTTPDQVVKYFYQAIDDKNVTLLEETNNIDMKRLDNMVMETHVIETMKSAYSTGEDRLKAEEQQLFGIKDVQISELPNSNQPTYRVNYRFYYHETKEGESLEDVKVIKHETQMEDIIKLNKIKGIWNIVEINGSLEYIINGNMSELIDIEKTDVDTTEG